MEERDKIEYIYNYVFNFFEQDIEKTRVWFETKNPYFGTTPIFLIQIGKTDIVYKYIINLQQGNLP